jgi:hypothetical protein
MGNGWLVVSHIVHCQTVIYSVIVSFLCYQYITIVVNGSGVIRYYNGFCGNNFVCMVVIESIGSIVTLSVMCKL